MRILLLGEYSRLHNTLKEALLSLGHDVMLVSTGDYFKKFPSDIDVSSGLLRTKFTKKTGVAFYKLFKLDIFKKDVYFNLKKYIDSFKNFDVVQLINEDAFGIYPEDEIKILNKIFARNKKSFVLACGEDTHVIDYYNSRKVRYSILNAYFENSGLDKHFAFSFKYLKPEYQELHRFVLEHVDGIIPSDLDYAIPYRGIDKVLPLIPNPVNVDRFEFEPLVINGKINIFHGINELSYYKKGSHIIIDVLNQIEKKYSNRVNITTVRNMPYNQYVQLYNQAHIFIDQLYSFDQGFNALEAMARGKCVLTGAEKEFETFYNLNREVAVNASPDKDKLYQTLEELILHPDRIVDVGKNARKFVEEKHHYKEVAKLYINAWQSV